MVSHIRKRLRDQRFQRHISSRHNQIFQVHRPVKSPVVILHKQRGNIVIVLCLRNQCTHRLLDREASANFNKICGHLAADLILLIRADELDILLGLLINQLDQLLSGLLIDLLEHIHRIIGIHIFDNVCCLFKRKLSQIFPGVIKIRKDFRHTLSAQNMIEHFALSLIQLVKRIRDIIVMVVGELLSNLLSALTASNQFHQLPNVVWFHQNFILQNNIALLYNILSKFFRANPLFVQPNRKEPSSTIRSHKKNTGLSVSAHMMLPITIATVHVTTHFLSSVFNPLFFFILC